MDRWTSVTTCRISRTLWPLPDQSWTKELLSFGKRTISILIGVLTGHSIFDDLAEILRVSRKKGKLFEMMD